MSAALALLQWQRALQTCAMRGDPGALLKHVRGDATATAGRRVAIYADAYRLRLIEVLGNDYPVLKALLGREAFAALANDYIDAHPSTTPSVRDFGRHFATWLCTVHAPLAQIELAAFEWAQGEVFDGRDADLAVLADMAGLAPDAWPALSLALQPAARVLCLRGNAAAQVAAHGRGEAIAAFVDSGEERHWLLWRRGFDVHWRALADDEATALAVLRAGGTFGELCAELAASIPEHEVAMRAAGLLKRWLCDELIVRFSIQS
jgi:hypothetical protein